MRDVVASRWIGPVPHHDVDTTLFLRRFVEAMLQLHLISLAHNVAVEIAVARAS